MDIFETYAEGYAKRAQEEMSLQDYLQGCRCDPMFYASAAERMVAAIGEPELIDSSKDPRLGRIFQNRTIKRYPAFAEFYGMEDTIERIVGYFRYAAQGLEERKQILYLLGPVGGGKSTLAEKLKRLMEEYPVYVLKAGDEVSPIFESLNHDGSWCVVFDTLKDEVQNDVGRQWRVHTHPQFFQRLVFELTGEHEVFDWSIAELQIYGR